MDEITKQRGALLPAFLCDQFQKYGSAVMRVQPRPKPLQRWVNERQNVPRRQSRVFSWLKKKAHFWKLMPLRFFPIFLKKALPYWRWSCSWETWLQSWLPWPWRWSVLGSAAKTWEGFAPHQPETWTRWVVPGAASSCHIRWNLRRKARRGLEKKGATLFDYQELRTFRLSWQGFLCTSPAFFAKLFLS